MVLIGAQLVAILLLFCFFPSHGRSSVGSSVPYCSVTSNPRMCNVSNTSNSNTTAVSHRSCCLNSTASVVLWPQTALLPQDGVTITLIDVDLIVTDVVTMRLVSADHSPINKSTFHVTLLNCTVTVRGEKSAFIFATSSNIRVALSMTNTSFNSDWSTIAAADHLAGSYDIAIVMSVVNVSRFFVDISGDPAPVPITVYVSQSTIITSSSLLLYFGASAVNAKIFFDTSTLTLYQGALGLYFYDVLSSVDFVMWNCTCTSTSTGTDSVGIAFAANAKGAAAFSVRLSHSVLNLQSASLCALSISKNMLFVLDSCSVTITSPNQSSIVAAGSNATVLITNTIARLVSPLAAWVSTQQIQSTSCDSIDVRVLDSVILSASLGMTILSPLYNLRLVVRNVTMASPAITFLVVATSFLVGASITIENSTLRLQQGFLLLSVPNALDGGASAWMLDGNVIEATKAMVPLFQLARRVPSLSVELGCNHFFTINPSQQVAPVIPLELGPNLGSVTKVQASYGRCWNATASLTATVTRPRPTISISATRSPPLFIPAPVFADDIRASGSLVAAGAVAGAVTDALGLSSFFLFVSCGDEKQRRQRGLTRYLLSPVFDFGPAAVAIGNAAIFGAGVALSEGLIFILSLRVGGGRVGKTQRERDPVNSRKRLRATLRLPGVYARVGGFFAIGPTLFGAGLIVSPDNAVDAAVGLWGLLCGVLTAIAYRIMSRLATKQLRNHRHPIFAQLPPQLRLFFASLSPRPLRIFQLYRAVTGAFSLRQARSACMVYIGTLLLGSAIAGIPFSSALCWLQWSLLAAIASLAALFYAVRRPFRIPVMNALECASFVNLALLDVCSLVLISSTTSSSDVAVWYASQGGVYVQLFLACIKILVSASNASVERLLPIWRRVQKRKQFHSAAAHCEVQPCEVVTESMIRSLFEEVQPEHSASDSSPAGSFTPQDAATTLAKDDEAERCKRSLSVLIRLISSAQLMRKAQDVHCDRLVSAAFAGAAISLQRQTSEEGGARLSPDVAYSDVCAEQRVVTSIEVASQLSELSSQGPPWSEPLTSRQLVEAAVYAICSGLDKQ